MTDFNPDSPLSPIAAETAKAHQALLDYYALGAGRSLTKLQQSYRDAGAISPPTVHLATITKWSTGYHWQARVAAQQAIDAEKERDEVRAKRRLLLTGVESKLAKAIVNLDVNHPTISEVVSMARLVVQELRAEYDDLPTQRNEHTGKDGAAIPVTLVEVVRDAK